MTSMSPLNMKLFINFQNIHFFIIFNIFRFQALTMVRYDISFAGIVA